MAVALLLASTSCTWLAARGSDLRDVFIADVGVGLGLGVDFQVTDAVHSGLGGGLTEKFGLRESHLGVLDSGFTAFESSHAFLTRLP